MTRTPQPAADRRVRRTAWTVLAAALLVACGQKPGVHREAAPVSVGGGIPGETTGPAPAGGALPGGAVVSPGGTLESPGGIAFGGTGTTAGARARRPAGTAGEGHAAARGGGGTARSQGAAAGRRAPSGGGGAAAGRPPSRGQARPQGRDRTGAGPDKLVYGVHAPVTGAAPIPSTSFREGRALYWRWWTVHQRRKVLGRSQVEVVFRDDRYNPSSAVQACREMARGEQTFLLMGGGGTDQIAACGRWADQSRVPYFSAGVTEQGLRGLPWYFAASMSYRQQSDLLGQLVRRRFPGRKAAAIITDTPNFDDAADGWQTAVRRYGIPYYKTLRHPKQDESWYDRFALELNRAGVQVVYPLTAPTDYIKFVKRAQAQNYNPQYVGVGITMGLQTVADAACPAGNGAMFFSPFFQLDVARQRVPEYFQTAQKEGYRADDLGLALWGLARQLHTMLERYGQVYGTDLTREDFRSLVEQMKNIQTGVFPALSYSPQDHFGANTVHLLQANCARSPGDKYVTIGTFIASF